MTVMPSGYDVADKAVSTDDNINEMICLDEMFSALVESKVESMKRASLNSLKDKKYCSNLLKNQKCTRLTSTSTTGSSSHHQLHHDYLKKNYSDERKNYRHRRRHDSAPCEKFIDELHGHQKRHGGSKARRRASELPRSSPRKRHRNSRHLHMQQQDDVHMGLDSQIELFGLDGDISLINFDRARETTNATIEYPRLHQSAYSPSAAHLKYIYDDDDFVTLNLEDEFELDSLQSSWNDQERDTNLKHENNNYHRSRRKRKKKRKRRRRVEDLIMEDVPEVLLVNQDDLSARARWTIVVTACVLFAMSLLLVGVTLRMAPIIDEMGDGRRASITRKSSSTRRASTHGSIHCKQSLKQGKLETQEAQLKKIIDKTLRDDAQARRHRRIASIVIGTFFILLAASVLVVIVTLTQSSFHAPQIGDRELAHHRAHHSHFLNFKNNNSFRKENEELINSLNRDPPVPVNNT